MDWRTTAFYAIRLTVSASTALFAFNSAFCAEETNRSPCAEDAIIVFDASGSMSGNQTLGVPNSRARIDEARAALAGGAERHQVPQSRPCDLWSRPLQPMQRQT